MRSRERGFALPLAAASIALLAVGLAVSADVMAGWSAAARRDEARWRLELAAVSVEARLAHMALTAPLAPRAFEASGGPLILDGRGYRVRVRGAGVFTVSVQDEAGLFNLNSGDEAAVGRFLRTGGVDARRVDQLAAALADLTDEDDLRRLNGAESGDYTSVGRPPPVNGPLGQVGDAWQALGWDRIEPRSARILLGLASAGDPARPFNPNTAPAAVLAAALGLEARDAETLMAVRETRAIVSFTDAAEASGVSLVPGEVPVAAQPARDFRAILMHASGAPEGSSIYVIQLHVAEAEADAPVGTRRFATTVRDMEWRQGNGRLEWLPDSPALPAARER